MTNKWAWLNIAHAQLKTPPIGGNKRVVVGTTV